MTRLTQSWLRCERMLGVLLRFTMQRRMEPKELRNDGTSWIHCWVDMDLPVSSSKYTPPSEIAMAQGSLLKLLLNTFGFFMSFCTISNARPPFRCDYGFNIRLGDSVYMNFDVVILDCALVTIGDHVLFGPGVHVYAATHPVEPPLRRRGYHDRELACPVSIGNNVWLGGRSVILPGVTIGDYAVIGAGAVVTRDVPAYAVVAGNPAKVIRVMQEEEIFTV
uniref:Maltose/galactoside acetyltransferase domain-containing protein n=1 Tax=Compsopogon caeruleus TaxID=31354 RepID=A0A7S1XA11_9RHOD|mmetsp:Transcript_11697/g.23817  ORF Transcript_11697/g.23817 Transcript_11697/m.23817 type:complete len:221 (+) Transcript_11697:508-1170(+)